MPAYKGTKELPNAANKQNRMMFTSMQKDREAMAKGRPDSVQRAEKGEGSVIKKMAKGGAAKAMPTAKQMGDLNMAKGGKVKKMALGGKTGPKQPTPTYPTPGAKFAAGGRAGTPTRPGFVPGAAASNASGAAAAARGMAKGGATKAGKAMVNKSADAKGRAMKFAKGGSIDGCATKGKTKTTMVKMARGGKMKKGC